MRLLTDFFMLVSSATMAQRTRAFAQGKIYGFGEVSEESQAAFARAASWAVNYLYLEVWCEEDRKVGNVALGCTVARCGGCARRRGDVQPVSRRVE